jgi:hypothetical protein
MEYNFNDVCSDKSHLYNGGLFRGYDMQFHTQPWWYKLENINRK